MTPHMIVQALGVFLMLTGAVFWASVLVWIGLGLFAHSPWGRRALGPVVNIEQYPRQDADHGS